MEAPSGLSRAFSYAPKGEYVLSVRPIFRGVGGKSLGQGTCCLPQLFVVPPSTLVVADQGAGEQVGRRADSFILRLCSLPLRAGSVGCLGGSGPDHVGMLFRSLFVLLFIFATYASAPGRTAVSCARCMGPFVKASFANGACPKTRIPFNVMRLDPSGKLPN